MQLLPRPAPRTRSLPALAALSLAALLACGCTKTEESGAAPAAAEARPAADAPAADATDEPAEQPARRSGEALAKVVTETVPAQTTGHAPTAEELANAKAQSERDRKLALLEAAKQRELEKKQAAAPQSKLPPADARPVFVKTEHHFGKSSDTEPLVTDFAFVNEGTEKLVIEQVKASCGCTTPRLEKTEFLPGEGDTIHVEWKAKGHGGQTKTVSVMSNSSETPLVVLTIRADIEPFIAFEPPQVNLGAITIGEEHVTRILASSVDPEMEITELESLNPNLKLELLDEELDGKKVIEATILASAPWGGFYGRFEVHGRGRPTPDSEVVDHVANLMVYASIFGEVTCEPSLFAVGLVEPGQPIRKQIIVARPSGEPFSFTSMEVRNGQPEGMSLRAEPLDDSHSRYRLILEGESGDYLGYIRGQAIYTTDIPKEGERPLAIAGIVREK